MEHASETDDREPVHVPVLPDEIVALVGRGPAASGSWIVDGTCGLGGHSARLLEAYPEARVLAIDQDPEILALAQERLEPFGQRALLRHARLSDLDLVLDEAGIGDPAALLLDLGVSSLQLDRAERGFSFQQDGPLDMRMDPRRERDAAEVVNTWDEDDLCDVLYWEGGETRARRLARAICEERRRAPFRRTGALADLCQRVLGPGGRIHAATRCFQALRRVVNEEGEELLRALAIASERLPHGAVLAVISFHSGEDGQVKRFLAEERRAGRFEVLTKKPLRAGREEVRANRRARSAVLRAAQRVRPQVGEARA